MKFGVPWSVKGLRPEARETAKEAARRSGMSLEDWLNSVIQQQAAQQGLHAQGQGEDAAHGPQLGAQLGAQLGGPIAGVHQRLNDVTRRLDQVTRPGPAAYAPRRAGPPLAAAMAPGLDQAVAEIAARRRALNGEPASAPPMAAPAQMTAPMPAQDLSGLEEQLSRITEQIETLRKPGVEEAINALRAELGEIGHALNEAMPRRAIDAIEKQVSGLSQRIAEGRQAGIDGNALAGLEHGLAEVRDVLRSLTPAENLVGFNEAVAGLAHKIDMIVAQNDPATLQQLESAITTLRGMAAHIASNEAVSQLSAEVQTLSEKVEHVAYAAGGSDALNHLEQRINAIAEALAERQQNGGAVPPRLEELVLSLSDKIEQIQSSRSDDVAMGHLEDRIVKLVEKLDASESRLGQLEAIERGLSDLLVHIEDVRTNRPAGLRADAGPGMDDLKHDIARTQDALEAVHGTLGIVVDRLATIEHDIRGEGRARMPADDMPAPPVGKLAVRAVSDAPSPAPEPARPQPPRMPQATPLQLPEPQPEPAAAAEPPPPPSPPPARRKSKSQQPINPDLPPDLPLEPGSGPPPRPNPAARIAASEAALGGAGPAGTPPQGKSSFIAAARRAAQAALQQAPAAAPRAEPQFDEADDQPSLRAKLMKRVKQMFVAASIIAIVVGSIQIMGNVFDRGAPKRDAAVNATKSGADSSKPEAAANDVGTPQTDDLAANTPTPAKPATAPPLARPGKTAAAPPLALGTKMQSAQSLLNPPLLSAPAPQANGDITGSIPSAAARRSDRAGRPAPASHGPLPPAIGSAQLRDAALAGDGPAAYEVAVRYAEGRGVAANLQEAAQWFERAASKGLALAQFRYASMLEKGRGIKKDLAAARRLYLAAASQGHAKAMHNLAVLYAEGIDGRPDYATAVKWFRQAAQRGISDSQYNLAILAARGLGMQQDLAESYKWFALAAKKGDQEAARKRDEVAARMEDGDLAAAQQAVKSFVPQRQPAAAIHVPKPEGGWGKAAAKSVPAKTAKPQTPAQANPQRDRQPHAPLSLGSFTIGKR